MQAVCEAKTMPEPSLPDDFHFLRTKRLISHVSRFTFHKAFQTKHKTPAQDGTSAFCNRGRRGQKKNAAACPAPALPPRQPAC